MRCFPQAFFLANIAALFFSTAFAGESYYRDSVSSCKVFSYHDGELTETNADKFKDRLINVRPIPKRPALVAFKYTGQIYVTKNSCVQEAESKVSPSKINSKSTKVSKSSKSSYDYFAEIESGTINISDKSAVTDDYNKVFPSTTTNPTKWGKATESSYKAGLLLSLGFGFGRESSGYWAFKVRLLNGQKTDTVELTDVNTGISQSGSWAYTDSFKNFYGGYKFAFKNTSAWKPFIALYLGVSHMTSTVTDGEDSSKMTSLGLGALAEAGVEYRFNSSIAIGASLGFEYLGNRTMNFSDEADGKKFKTKMSYNNQYLAAGLKYYF